MSVAPAISRRALNRALLARQLLLARAPLDPLAALEHVVGLQAQVPQNPYVALWSRLDRFRPEALSGLIAERQAVRIVVMRSTIHLVSAADALTLRPLTQPVIGGELDATHWGRDIAGVDRSELAALGARLLAEQPQTNAQLGARLGERWPDHPPLSLAYAVRCLVPLVQVPPRGLWGGAGRTTHAPLEHWVGRPVDRAPSLEALVVRYLAAFGPATAADVQAWSRLKGLRPTLEALRPQLRTFRDERGRELLDVADGLLPDPASPAPPRFLPEYDNVFLSHADRARILPDVRPGGGAVSGRAPILVDGFLGAWWRLERARGAATLVIEPFARLPKQTSAAVEREGLRLLDVLAADGDARDVRFLA